MEIRADIPLAKARGNLLLRFATVMALTMLMTLLYAGGAWAETFTVSNTKDSGAGSLRSAIEAANVRAGADEIVFADGVSGTVTLDWYGGNITDPAGLVIDGGGDVTVSGNHGVGVFWVLVGAKLELRNLTVTDGAGFRFGESPEGWGGGVLNEGTLTVADSTIAGNSATFGGGIFNGVVTVSNEPEATLTVTNSTISGNGDTFGGGIYNFGSATVTGSTFTGNSAQEGGGILNAGMGTMKVSGSTFSGNSAEMRGGGIINGSTASFPGTTEVINSTFSDNSASEGGGIWNSGAVTMTNSTLYGNSASDGGAILNAFDVSGAHTTLSNTIVAGSPSGGNCSGVLVTDGGHNVSDDATCGLTQATGSLPNTDPLLDPEGLQDNGGPTQTIALQPESTAVDLVAPDACPPPATDQRGVQRPQGDACDSGAYELEQQVEPKTKADCKKGGWRGFGFKNQGQCLKFVQRNAKTTQ